MTGSPARAAATLIAGLAAGLMLTVACTPSPSPGDAPSPAGSPKSSTTSVRMAKTPTGSTTTTASGSASSRATAATSPTPATAGCGQQLAQRLPEAARAGQLLMVGLQPTGSSRALAAQVRAQRLGGVIYLGGWSGGAASVATVSRRLQTAAGGTLLVAADQEGGQVQQLHGPDLDAIPSARTQATLGASGEERAVRGWARQLATAGVNVNLAPVADTVPTSLGSANQPIGRYRRDFSPGNAGVNARYVAAFVRGTLAAGVAPTVKHFPGLGRVTGNTDVTSTGITDPVTGVDDPYLAPFQAGIRAGVPLVMVSSARYPRLDAEHQAMFSSAVITGLLRQRLGFTGVVVTDDVGAAAAVAEVPVGARATRFIAAGGDLVLTARADQAAVMLRAIAAKRATSPAFGQQVDLAAARVLDLKVRLGLVRCS